MSVDLPERLKDADEFSTGVLRIDFVSVDGALQTWAVVRSGQQIFEVPFIASDKNMVTELFSFWDTALAGPRPKVLTEYMISNTTGVSVPYTFTISRGKKTVRTETGVLGPLQTRTYVANDSETTHRGWLRIAHNGAPGAVVGAGILSGQQRLAYLPVVGRSSLARGPGFEILRVPEPAGSAIKRASLTLFSTDEKTQRVKVDAVSIATGSAVGSEELSLEPWEVVNVDLKHLVRSSAGTQITR